MQNQKKKQKKRNCPTTSRKATKNSRNSSQKNTPAKRNGFKVPEALPTKKYRENGLSKLKQVVFRKKPEIKEIVREPTAGGIVFRPSADNKDIEILLIQDSKDRWTIPKGHIEPGETAKQTAVREIGEESGLKEVDVLGWLGKIHFKYRRADKLVLMTTQVYLVQSLDKNERPTKEKWMNGIRWFSFNEALDAIEYADIEKLMLIAKRRVRNGEFDG
jgi:ADP-ribose pyrophosphatase YjhB (NUDIX family)